MAATTSSTLSNELQTYFNKTLLKQATYKVKLDQFGNKTPIPANSSKTINFSQYSDLTVSTSALTEGTTPTDTQLAVTTVPATTSQYGAYVTLTDLAQLTPKHSVTQKTQELLSTQAARTYDRIINSVLVAGTTVRYANGAASRAATAAAITFADIKYAVTQLRKNGATEFDDGNFVAVIDPSVEADLLADTTFQNTVYRQASPTKGNELYKGAIATFGGVTFVRSNNIPVVAGTGPGLAAGSDIHTTYVFGQDSYAMADLQNIEMYVEGPGSNTDPLHQRSTMGWKFAFAAVITNQNWLVRIESTSAN